jgi:hypothetical protein
MHDGEKNPTGRVLGYSAESALLLVARAIPSAPPLFTTVVAADKRTRFTLLFFLSALVNFLGMAHRVLTTVIVLVPRFVGNRYCVPYALQAVRFCGDEVQNSEVNAAAQLKFLYLEYPYPSV